MEEEPLIKEKKKLYGKQTELTMENMSFSGRTLSMFPDYIQAGAKVKKACVLANFRAGLISEDKKDRISAACDEIIEGKYLDQFPVDVYHGGGGIGLNMNLNEVIASLAGDDIDPVNDVNLSQSTSDVCHTSLRLAVYDKLVRVDEWLDDFCAELDRKKNAFANIETIARTCMQDGLRVPASAVFEGTSEALKMQKKEVLFWKDESLGEINLGWTVIGSGDGANEEYRKHILQALRETTDRNISWIGDPYNAAEYPVDLAGISGFTNRLALILSKFARDVRLLSSGPQAGFGEWKIPDVQAGSSFFPGKVNPVIAEMMIQCSMIIEGNNMVIQNALGLGEVHLNVWEEMMGFLLLDSMQMLGSAAKLFREKCVSGIEINREVCERYANSRIPLVAAAKEKYGYKYLSDWVHASGFETVAAALLKEKELIEKNKNK